MSVLDSSFDDFALIAAERSDRAACAHHRARLERGLVPLMSWGQHPMTPRAGSCALDRATSGIRTCRRQEAANARRLPDRAHVVRDIAAPHPAMARRSASAEAPSTRGAPIDARTNRGKSHIIHRRRSHRGSTGIGARGSGRTGDRGRSAATCASAGARSTGYRTHHARVGRTVTYLGAEPAFARRAEASGRSSRMG